jgi:hypothetical protein
MASIFTSGRRLIDLEVKDKTLVGHRPNAGPNPWVVDAPVRMGYECPHVGEVPVDANGGSLDRILQVVPEFLVNLN